MIIQEKRVTHITTSARSTKRKPDIPGMHPANLVSRKSILLGLARLRQLGPAFISSLSSINGGLLSFYLLQAWHGSEHKYENEDAEW